MSPKEGHNTTITTIRAPHSILDLGTAVRTFEKTIPSLIVPGARNIGIFEDAGGHTRDEAMRFRDNIRQGSSVLREIIAANLDPADPNHKDPKLLERQQRIHTINNLMQPPLDETHQAIFSKGFWDHLLIDNPRKIDVIPENCETENMRSTTRAIALQNTAPLIIKQSITLEQLIAIMQQNINPLNEQVVVRDNEIGKFLQWHLTPDLLRKGIRTNVIIVIGKGHNGISRNMSSRFLENIDYKEIVINDHGEAADFDDEIVEVEVGLTKERASRIVLFKVLIKQIKQKFLAQNSDKRLKEMEGVQEGTSITHQILKICESLTQEEVYMILQEAFNVDCGLNPNDYPTKELPFPLNANTQILIHNLDIFVSQGKVINLDTTQIGMHLDQQLILNAMLILFDMPKSKNLESAFNNVIRALPPEFLTQFKNSLITGLSTGTSSQNQDLYELIGCIIQRDPGRILKGVNKKSLELLSSYLISTNRAKISNGRLYLKLSN